MKENIKTIKANQKERKLVCPSCGTESSHRVLANLQLHGEADYGIEYWENYLIVQCLGCKTIGFCRIDTCTEDFDFNEDGETWLEEKITRYPAIGSVPKKIRDKANIPEHVYVVYDETYTAFCNGLSVLTAVGIRTLIEIIAAEKGARGKLYEKINELVEKGFLSVNNADYLHKLRLMGNFSAHEAIEYTNTQLEAAFNIAEHLIETVYVIPAKSVIVEKGVAKNSGKKYK